jgi:Uma2 family endonuclease
MTVEHTKALRWKNPPASTRQRASVARADQSAEELVESAQPHPGCHMTEEDFLAWVGEKTRAEWVDGEIIIMSPVNVEHDDLQGWIYTILRTFVEAHDLGRVGGSELMVRLGKPQARRLPDVFFVSKDRLSAFGKTAYEGPPDLIVEIVSPDSTARDYRDKLKTYESSGVREYWIVDPLARSVESNELVKGAYRTIEPKQGAIHSRVLKGFFIRPEWCWQQPLPKVTAILRELGPK